jgi:hypothetical protein
MRTRAARPVRGLIVTFVASSALFGCRDASGPVRGDVPEWSLTVAARVEPSTPFGRVSDLEIASDGSVFVLDALNRTVRVFDREGAELRDFGRRGEGPGELEDPTSLLWGPDDNVWVLDARLGRLTVFDAEGVLVATHSVAGLSMVFPLALGSATGDTLRWVALTAFDPTRPSSAWLQSRVTADGIEPLDQQDLSFVEWPLPHEYRTDEVALALPVPFSGEPVFAFDASGRLWYAYTGGFRVHRWSPSDGLELTLGRELPPEIVTASDREQVLGGADFDELRALGGQQALDEVAQLIPETWPHLAGFTFDEVANVWVLRAMREAGEERLLDVYGADGTLIATTSAPMAAAPRPRIRDGRLAAIVRDSLGVESLALYRIERMP